MTLLLYRVYQIIILPLLLLSTLITGLVTIIGCSVGNGHFWGYYPGKIWSQFICFILLIPVKVEGRENLSRGVSYVFVANHQGALDIFLIYGFLGRPFKWMMKKSIRKMLVVGKACEKAKHIYVDKSGPKKIKETIEKADQILREGTSLVVFPEGARTFTGHMGIFKKGAFWLADELKLPVVPLTINGSFDILPRTKGFNFINWRRMKLTIHKPIYPTDINENIDLLLKTSYEEIMGDLEEKYQGYVENKDQ